VDDIEWKEILPPPRFELQPLGRPARSQSLYRLRYLYVYSAILKTIVLIYDFICTHAIWFDRIRTFQVHVVF
jgi:hypothetical protein